MPKVVEVTKVIEVPVLQPAASVDRRPFAPPPPSTSTGNRLLWYGLIAGAILVGAVAIALALMLRRRRSGEADRDDSCIPFARTFGFLEPRDEPGVRHPITSVAFRIGRQEDNDLVVKDPSISRHHAEIHRRRDGTFTITDLESMNGVFVNNKKQRKATLTDGDSVEIGDVAMTFSVQTQDDLGGEETVMLKTVLPTESLEETLGDVEEQDQRLA